MDWRSDTFKDPTGQYIQCSTHGALFRVANGRCIAGPPLGARLPAVAVKVRDGDVVLEDA